MIMPVVWKDDVCIGVAKKDLKPGDVITLNSVGGKFPESDEIDCKLSIGEVLSLFDEIKLINSDGSKRILTKFEAE